LYFIGFLPLPCGFVSASGSPVINEPPVLSRPELGQGRMSVCEQANKLTEHEVMKGKAILIYKPGIP
jgi:hypothetical protein